MYAWGGPLIVHVKKDDPEIADLIRSNDELRAILIMAGREIRKLNFGRRDTPLLKKMRQLLREARALKPKRA
jgi:hypothetical protein